MNNSNEDTILQQIIEDEVTVDCYDEYEVCSGWQCWLGDNLATPFEAVCRAKNARSPLGVGEQVTVLAMVDTGNFTSDMFVSVRWQGREFGVPLEQLQAIDPTPETQTAMDVWAYWVRKGYSM